MANYLPPEFTEEATIATGDTATADVDGVGGKQHRFVAVIVKASTAGTFSVICGAKTFVEDMAVLAGQQVAVGPFKGVGCGIGDAAVPATGRLRVIGASLGAGGRVSLVHFTHPEG